MSEAERRKIIGNKIRSLRKHARLTQTTLAERTKVSIRTIVRIELGAANVHEHKLRDVARALGTTVEELEPTASADEANSGLRVGGVALEKRLEQELAVTDWRGLIVVVVAAPGLAAVADDALAHATTGAGIGDDQILRYVVTRDDSGRERLRAHNRARDRLLASHRVIYLRAGSAADVRFLREVAPDLTASIDVFVELEQPETGGQSWGACSASLRALMQERHALLDFTGLLPANVEQRMLPLPELYQELVDFRVPSRQLTSVELPGWLILGHPGSGKTTHVRHLAWVYARGGADPLDIGAKVPLLVSLADYGYSRANDRVRCLVDFLPVYLAERQVASAATVLEHLPDVVLLLDGLDELLGPAVRREVLDEIGALLIDGKLGAVVVTGRSFLVDELESTDRLRLARTRSPTPEQLRAFVTTFVRLRGGQAQHADDLVARIEQDADLRVLAGTPLMLAFMVILDELEGRLPDRRIEIYFRLGELLVDRWTRARSIGASASQRQRPTRADAMRVLGPLAWWTLERGGIVSEQELLEEIEHIEMLRETPDEAKRRASALLELLRADTALLVPLPDRRWSFVHQSIAEYFAGVEAERDPRRWAALLAEPTRPEWREIVLFCAGQLGVIDGRIERLDQLVEAMLRAPHEEPGLLARLLLEPPGLSRRQIDQLLAKLLELLFTSSYVLWASGMSQEDVTRLITGAQASVREGLATQMREWFAVAGRIEWDVIIPFDAIGNSPELVRAGMNSPSTRGAVDHILGPFIATLVDLWVTEFGIDLEPTIAEWSRHDTWPHRLAVWWLRSDPTDRDRPFAEVEPQI